MATHVLEKVAALKCPPTTKPRWSPSVVSNVWNNLLYDYLLSLTSLCFWTSLLLTKFPRRVLFDVHGDKTALRRDAPIRLQACHQQTQQRRLSRFPRELTRYPNRSLTIWITSENKIQLRCHNAQASSILLWWSYKRASRHVPRSVERVVTVVVGRCGSCWPR